MRAAGLGEVAEAKQRRSAFPGEQGRLVTDLVAASDLGLPEGADRGDKGRRSLAGAFRAALGHVHRRLNDIVAASVLWSSWALGYLYATGELLQPPDSLVVQLMSVVCHAIFALAILSWLGCVYHGPGRVPGEEQACRLPPAIASALAVGRFCWDHPFGPEDGWCGACGRWKPPLAHHCSICRRCGLWMDHHCNFAMQCIGFRNLRCFLLMLFYTQLLSFMFMPLVVRRVCVGPHLGTGGVARLVAFCLGWAGLTRFVRYFSRTIVAKASAGWPSHVMLVKYKGIFRHAAAVETDQAKRKQAGACAPQLEALQQLLLRLRRRTGGLRGFLKAGDFLGSMALVFGEPPSWRWLLPLLPGGSGNPLQPAVFDAKACEDWAALAQLLDSCNEVVMADNRTCQVAVDLWSQRIQAMLAGAEDKISKGSLRGADARGGAGAAQAAVPPAMAPPREGVTMGK